jgi:hypothetical protein
MHSVLRCAIWPAQAAHYHMLSPMSTFHKSLQHTLSIFQPAVCSPTFSWQRLVSVEILQLHALKSSLHRLPYRTDLFAPIFFKITPRHEPRRNTMFQTVPQLLRVDSLLRVRIYLAVAQKRVWHICLSRDRPVVTALHATIF